MTSRANSEPCVYWSSSMVTFSVWNSATRRPTSGSSLMEGSPNKTFSLLAASSTSATMIPMWSIRVMGKPPQGGKKNRSHAPPEFFGALLVDRKGLRIDAHAVVLARGVDADHAVSHVGEDQR